VDGAPRAVQGRVSATEVRVRALALASPDRPLLECLRAVLGAGSIEDRGQRRVGWLPEPRLTVASEAAHLERTIPFADRFLAPCEKRKQFEVWRDRLLDYRSSRESFLGHRYPPRRRGTDGAAIFTVQARADLVRVVVPFADRYLPPSRRLAQYVAWRAPLLAGGYSPDASGRSAAIASQSSRGASDQSRSRS
jgi:hypothetical protein